MATLRHPGEGLDLRTRSHGVAPRGPGLRRDDDGFTLVELMVVLVIIGLLATIVIINVMPATDQAAVTKARADIATLEQGMEMYRLKHMNYPGGGDGLQLLVSERLVKRLPKDPWGNPYKYRAPGQHGEYDLWSEGADGAPGGEGENTDIVSWDVEKR